MSTSETPPAKELPAGLLKSAIERPVTVVSLMILLSFFGALSIFRLPIQLTPDVTLPTISVNTTWPGASPVEVETEILEEQEEVLKRIQGLELMESTARLGSAEINLEFAVGTDLDQALVRVSNQLSQVPSYPDDADQPVVATSNRSGPPLAVILVRHKDGKTIAPYRSWVENDIVPELERVKGISSTRMRGGQENEVHIVFDTRELAARGLSVPDLVSRVREELKNRSAGDVSLGKRRLIVRSRLAPDNALGLRDLVLSTGPNGSPVLLRDVARVERGLRKRTDFAIGDTREAIALLPTREAGSNVLEVTEELRRTVERLHEEAFLPEGLELEMVSDQTGYIYDALDQVRRNLLIGAGLAMIVLLLFLRSVSAAAVVAIAIPVCVLGTALGMTLLGRSVNVVSLAGVTFAVGMVVDNSIVALENIDTWRKRVSDSRVAALSAIREVWGAILASTATTAAVFIPILTWEGEVGELLRDIAYAVAISVSLSLVVAVLAIPSLAARLLSGRQKSEARRMKGLVERGEGAKKALAGAVRYLIERSRRSIVLVIVGVGLTSGAALWLLPDMEYLPNGNRNLIFGIVLPPPGLSVEELMETGFENQRIMQEHVGKKVDGVPAVERSFFVGDPSRLFIGAVAENPDEVRGLRDYMAGLHARIPGSIGFAAQAALFSRGIGEGRAIELVLTGTELRQLVGTGQKMFGRLREAVPGSRIRPEPVLDQGAPELHLVPRREQLELSRLSPQKLALIADAYVDGARIGEYGEEGARKDDVLVMSGDLEGRVLDEMTLSSAPVADGNGNIVPLGILADIETRLGPMAIARTERQRTIKLQVTPPDDMPFETAINAVKKAAADAVRDGTIPTSVKYSLAGSAGKLVKAQKQFGWILLVALLISYFLLAGLFEDFLAPIVVLVSIPLAAAGGVLALTLVDEMVTPQPLDLMTALGFLILIGVVVNNAILIVDGALARIREGTSLVDATVESVDGRIRPIFMSTLTSLAGLLPMVVTTGAGGELYRGVGTIVLGGLALSTVLSLFVVPALFTLLFRARYSMSGSQAVSA